MAMFERFVVACDGSEQSRAGIDLAFELAGRCGAQLTLAHVVELPDPHPELPEVAAGIEMAEQDWRSRLAALAGDAPGRVSVDTEVLLASKPAPALLDLLDARRSDVLVAGTHGVGGLKRTLLGSVSQQLLEHAPCSVLLVRQEMAPEGPPSVVAAVDGSEATPAVVAAAQAVATTLSARLLLVHVIGEQVVPFTTPDATREQRDWAREQGRKVLTEARAIMSAPLETVSQELRIGVAKEELVQACEAGRPTLAVVGSRGAHGSRDFCSAARHAISSTTRPAPSSS